MPNSKEIEAKSHNPVPQGYVLGAEGGEHLIHFRDGGNIFIKVDPVKGSNNLALGTQQKSGVYRLRVETGHPASGSHDVVRGHARPCCSGSIRRNERRDDGLDPVGAIEQELPGHVGLDRQ